MLFPISGMKFFLRRPLLPLALLACLSLVSALAAEALLDPEAAFRFSAKMVDSQTVQVRYQIADGYYMYRDRFRFAATQRPVTLGTPRLPAGTIKADEFFGNVETYRGALVFELPLESSVPDGGFTLQVISQGCADIGVRYLPLTQAAKLTPAVYSDAREPASNKSSSLLARLQDRRSADEEDFLPVEKAFKAEVRAA